MPNDQKKTKNQAPKVKHSSRRRVKYEMQWKRTAQNKLRRIKKHNGSNAALSWSREYANKRIA